MVLRQITDEVMFEIRNLSGQEYVDSLCRVGRAEGEDGARGAAPTASCSTPGARAAGVARGRREVLIASAASNGGLHAVAFEADGVERRSSSAAIRSRPLDLELTSA